MLGNVALWNYFYGDGGQDFWYGEKNRGRFGVEHLELDLCFIDLGVHVL